MTILQHVLFENNCMSMSIVTLFFYKKRLNIIYSTAISRHAYIPSDNLLNNCIEEQKPDVVNIVCFFN